LIKNLGNSTNNIRIALETAPCPGKVGGCGKNHSKKVGESGGKWSFLYSFTLGIEA
jgi:hypothetical protein